MGLQTTSLVTWLLLAIVLILSCVTYSHSLAVVSVDLGSEWMKVAYVSVSICFIITKEVN